MRDQIIALLAFPATLIQSDVADDACRHQGNFCHADPECKDCQSADECAWLCGHDSQSLLEKRSTPALVAALEFSMEYVGVRVALWGHAPEHCNCDTCSWLRSAEQLMETILHWRRNSSN